VSTAFRGIYFETAERIEWMTANHNEATPEIKRFVFLDINQVICYNENIHQCARSEEIWIF